MKEADQNYGVRNYDTERSDRQMCADTPGKKSLILGCCMTGAKYTPGNHRQTGDRILDAICMGDFVPVSPTEIRNEVELLFDEDCRYIRIHARNPLTKEQVCDRGLYAKYGCDLSSKNDDLLLSYGASRNGVEVLNQVTEQQEWIRIAHSTLDRNSGGADFVTLQAAAELQVACDMERQKYVSFDHETGRFRILKPLENYRPSDRQAKVQISNGSEAGSKTSNYGVSSARLQFDFLQEAVRKRVETGLPLEVEWVQSSRSHFLTWYILNHILREQPQNARLNITILFGFSPRLPIPRSFDAFLQVVRNAKQVARSLPDQRYADLTVSVGASVLPRHADALRQKMDVGPLRGRVLSPLERIVAYSCQQDSGVDLVRTGLEDTPFLQDQSGSIIPSTNLQLVQHAKRIIADCGACITTDRAAIHRFAGEDRTFARTGKFFHTRMTAAHNNMTAGVH